MKFAGSGDISVPTLADLSRFGVGSGMAVHARRAGRIERGNPARCHELRISQPPCGSDWAQWESGTFRFRNPLNKERRFLPLRLDDAPSNWLPASRIA